MNHSHHNLSKYYNESWISKKGTVDYKEYDLPVEEAPRRKSNSYVKIEKEAEYHCKEEESSISDSMVDFSYVSKMTPFQFKKTMGEPEVISKILLDLGVKKKFGNCKINHAKLALENCNHGQYLDFVGGKSTMAILIS
jgi:hypothetical protein